MSQGRANYIEQGIRLAGAGAMLSLLAACGGGGATNSVFTPTGGMGGTASTITGVVSKGPVGSAQVCAYAVYGGVATSPIGNCVTTDAAGNYSINLGVYVGPLLLQALHGTYVDESTGSAVSLDTATSTTTGLRSLVSNSAGVTNVAITALTEIAYEVAQNSPGQLITANINSAIASVQNNFGVPDILYTMPVDALNVPNGASAAQVGYALALATVSQYATTTGAGVGTALGVLRTCLGAPSATSCGSGNASLGSQLNTAMTTFKASNSALAAFTYTNLQVANFGYGSAGGTGITPSPGTPAALLAGVSVPPNYIQDGNSAVAIFGQVAGVATTRDNSGNLYVADSTDDTIRQIDATGRVVTIAGTPGVSTGARIAAGTCSAPCTGDGVGANASFGALTGITYDGASGNLFVTDGETVRMVTLAGAHPYTVTTIAGFPGNNTWFAGTLGVNATTSTPYPELTAASVFDAGTGTSAVMFTPTGLVADGSGNLYVITAAYASNLLRKISLTPPYAVSTLAGGGLLATAFKRQGRFSWTSYSTFTNGSGFILNFQDLSSGSPGYYCGTLGCTAKVGPQGGFSLGEIDFDASVGHPTSGNVLLADGGANAIRMITPSGVVSTYAGASSPDGSATTVPFAFTSVGGVAVDGNTGILYVLDNGNTIWQISPPAGSTPAAVSLVATGPTIAPLALSGIRFDAGNGVLYAYSSGVVYTVPTAGGAITRLTGLNPAGVQDGVGMNARFSILAAMTADTSNNLYVSDNGSIRQVALTGVVNTIAGVAGVSGFADGNASAASFASPPALAFDSSTGHATSGGILVADTTNNAIRFVSLSGSVSTYAGPLPTDGVTPGPTGFADGTGSAALFNSPRSVVTDSAGNTYVSDAGNNAIRKIAPGGVVTTYAGPPPTAANAGSAGYQDAAGNQAQFNYPTVMAIDSAGNVYVVDASNNLIRKIDTTGNVTTQFGVLGAGAGSASGTYCDTVDAANAASTGCPGATILNPQAMAVDDQANIYLIDNGAVRKISTAGVATTVNIQTGSYSGILPVALLNPTALSLVGSSLFITSGDGVIDIPKP